MIRVPKCLPILFFALTACAEKVPGTVADDGPVPLAPPASGVQFASEPTPLEPGEEAYRCFEFELPKNGVFPLVGIETQATALAVHHFGVFTNALAKDGTKPYECEAMGAAWGLVSGGGVGTPAMQFPEGTAMTLDAGAHIVLQLHLINASSQPTTVDTVRVNLVSAQESASLASVGLLITGTLAIDIPAKSANVLAKGGCEPAEPLEHVFAAFPHMHKLGRRIETHVVPVGGGAARSLSDVTWDFSDQGIYPVDGTAKAGERIETSCTFDNPLDTAVEFGLHTANEMCVNVLYYYPAKERSSFCGIP